MGFISSKSFSRQKLGMLRPGPSFCFYESIWELSVLCTQLA
jgi:hypothetical protein